MIKNTYIIDDDLVSMFVTEFVLDGFSEALITYTSAEQALTAIVEKQTTDPAPYIIFLDLNMPAMDGWDFLQAFSKQADSLLQQGRVVILSSAIHKEETARAAEFPIVMDVITKPLELHHITALQEKLQQLPA